VTIASGKMDIRCIDDTEDSRCPDGVECFWAGQVSCAIEITKFSVKNSITLTDTGSGMSTGYDFQNYQTLFSVTPSPVAGKKIAKSDYRLTLIVSQLRY